MFIWLYQLIFNAWQGADFVQQMGNLFILMFFPSDILKICKTDKTDDP